MKASYLMDTKRIADKITKRKIQKIGESDSDDDFLLFGEQQQEDFLPEIKKAGASV